MKSIYKYTHFDDRTNEAIHTTIINNTVTTTRESRFEYEQRIHSNRHPQKDWKKTVHDLGNA